MKDYAEEWPELKRNDVIGWSRRISFGKRNTVA